MQVATGGVLAHQRGLEIEAELLSIEDEYVQSN